MTESELKRLQKALDHLAAGREKEADRALITSTLQSLIPALESLPGSSLPEALSHLGESQAEVRRLHQRLEQQESDQEVLRKVSLNLTSSLNLQEVLRSILDAAIQLVKDVENAHVFLYESGKLSFGAAQFRSGFEREPYTVVRPHGLTYSVARLSKVISVADMSTHPLFRGTQWAGSIIGIPLKIGLRVVGVMTAYRSIRQDYSDAERHILLNLADHASIAIENARLNNLVDQQAPLDPLTGLHNRRSLHEQLERELNHYRESGGLAGTTGSQRSFSLLILDLDGFTQINNRYGRQAGDYVLKEVSYAISQALRKTDFLARIGGDEMAVILSDTDRELSAVIAGRIQEYVATSRFNLPDIRQKAMTVSIGIALYPEHGSSGAEMINAADRALRQVKADGPGGIAFADLPAQPA